MAAHLKYSHHKIKSTCNKCNKPIDTKRNLEHSPVMYYIRQDDKLDDTPARYTYWNGVGKYWTVDEDWATRYLDLDEVKSIAESICGEVVAGVEDSDPMPLFE